MKTLNNQTFRDLNRRAWLLLGVAGLLMLPLHETRGLTATNGDSHEINPQDDHALPQLEKDHAKGQESEQQAISAFGVVRLSVSEQPTSKKSRKKIRKKLEISPESKTSARSSEDITGGDVLGMTLYSTLYGGPIVAAGVALGGTMALTFNAVKKQFKSSRKRTQIKPAVKALSRALAAEDPEKYLTDALLISARRKQTSETLTLSPSKHAADSIYHLTIEIRKLALYQVPGNEKLGRLWISTQAKLESTDQLEPAKERSFCYGSDYLQVEDLAEDLSHFRERLSGAYGNLSERILLEYFALPAERDTKAGWYYTDKMCPKPIASIKLAGGVYTGETKDGKPHGVGEIRYKNEGWTTLYRGRFVDGQEHGEGRCRYKAGGWGYCRYYKGKRT